jgi:hypothetical protein
MEIEGLTKIDMWYVQGISNTYFDNKMAAEKAARDAFPNESADKRYARVFYKTMYYEEV